MLDQDNCVYIKRRNSKYIIMYLYVDAILIVGNDKGFPDGNQGLAFIGI